MQKKQNNRDSLFDVEQISEDFIFNERVAQVFDDMLDRSIPFYREVIHSIARILDTTLEDNSQIVDLGCATGTTLLQLSSLLEKRDFQYTGIDNSSAMLDKAQLKAELFSKQECLKFIQGDIMNMEQPCASAFILNYTLQFIRPINREKLLKQIYTNLAPDGICILSEKIISHHPNLNRKYIDMYHTFKKERGYSELEIAKKREALENILIPCSLEENKAMLQSAGFVEVEPFFQWFNFVSFIAVKPLT
ncbi:carboxy-S-adenosyl-L-methionine synthase CmoA [Desulfocapsa sp. AH-315-G09]|uniref:Carboxy-S-adenosyl-L-methionine synthase n=1 Tax=Desulfotalea psychrophila TaxID=84980 RepID=A0ABS3AUS7_9BACT|nr:carboxy-S-adenosyl-L-methionine synthase CmoA [Desulfocapsa sp.]MBN4045920.1 carboxy-S-adenosyl-L-methionine synthase CmoA [bacterium AH-315-P11]MBN4048634.1 carboxy-S-adenosyl-L-methionine synthase CmoA [bacterium AH-315-N22]MBN4065580.1 carboxy-S-adenosyl-L-methionine synthase CmoA [Desulfocapsa sp. AH-315-G09]MBN4068280.1 carboxy-S-adenosyl-L-methionine synthase CmoA [Desulfotalea psychrophila]